MTGKTQTSTSQQTSTPVNTAALQSISNQVASAASTPYTPYSGELTAGINGQQTAGINTINQGANAAQPYYAQAGQLASSAANPLTASQIQQYQNPYTQNVVNATQAQFNDQNGQQQNSLKGTAAQQGALGGDRQAVAQSQLAGQQQLSQAPVIAGLYSNSYNSGLQTAAQQYQQNPLAAASALGNIGAGTENAAIAGGTAQIGAGTLQQQTQQAGDTANYNQYLAQQANPYQNAAFAEQYGLPAALGQGSTSSGTQTAPGPSVLGQIAGLGIAGAGVASKFETGGRVGFASGGSPGYVNSQLGYIDSGAGYIPAAHPSGSTSLNAPQLQFAKPQQTDMKPVTTAIGGLPSFKSPTYGGDSFLTGENGGSSSNPLPGLDASDYGAGYKIGGLVEAIHHIHRTIKGYRNGGYADGGTPLPKVDPREGSSEVRGSYSDLRSTSPVTIAEDLIGRLSSSKAQSNATRDAIRQNAVDTIKKYPDVSDPVAAYRANRYADGGDTSFADRFAPATDNPFGDLSRRQAIALLDQSRDGTTAPSSIGGNDPAPPIAPTAQGDQGVVNPDSPYRMDPSADQSWRAGVDQPNPAVAADSSPSANPMANPGLPPQITNPDSAPEQPSSAMAFDSTGKQPTPLTPPSAQDQPTSALNPFHLSDKGSNALIAAGLGMLASRSPFAGVALGEGGLQGLKSYSEETKAEREDADKKINQDLNKRRVDMEAQRIAQSASQFAKTQSLAERRQKFTEDKTPAGYREKEDGSYEAIPGGPADPAVLKTNSEAKTTKYVPAGSIISDGSVHPAVLDQATGKIIDAVTGQPPKDGDKVQTKDQSGKNSPEITQHIADGIKSGRQPPTLTGLYGQSGSVRSKLEEDGFDLSKAQVEWDRAKKQVATLNGPQMTRFVGLAKSVDSTIDEVRNLSKEMDNSGIPKLNAAKLALYMQAEGNSENGQLAARYIGAVNTLKEEFANLANGGYAPTEPAWELANKQINGDYGVKQLGASLDEVQRLVRYRVNAIPGLNEVGPGASNRYTGNAGQPAMGAAPPAGAPAAPSPPAGKPATIKQGNYTYNLQPDGSYK